jgi:hypothetical protein
MYRCRLSCLRRGHQESAKQKHSLASSVDVANEESACRIRCPRSLHPVWPSMGFASRVLSFPSSGLALLPGSNELIQTTADDGDSDEDRRRTAQLALTLITKSAGGGGLKETTDQHE